MENQKFLGENGFGFGGSFLQESDQYRSRDGSMMQNRVAAQDQDYSAVEVVQAQGLDAELDNMGFAEEEQPQFGSQSQLINTPSKTPKNTETQLLPYTFKDFSTSVPLNEEQAAKVTQIIVIMQETGETGHFDIQELPDTKNFGQQFEPEREDCAL